MYQVQKIVGSRINDKGKKEYQVKWVGYSNAENTWEPAKNLVSVKEILDEWNRKEDAKQGNKKTINKSLAKPQTVQKTQGAIQNNDAYESDSDKFVQASVELTDSFTKQNSNADYKINGAPKRKVKLRVDRASKDGIKIIGVNQSDDQKLVFKVEMNGITKWVDRDYLVPNYMLDLINFYEAAICFND